MVIDSFKQPQAIMPFNFHDDTADGGLCYKELTGCRRDTAALTNGDENSPIVHFHGTTSQYLSKILQAANHYINWTDRLQEKKDKAERKKVKADMTLPEREWCIRSAGNRPRLSG